MQRKFVWQFLGFFLFWALLSASAWAALGADPCSVAGGQSNCQPTELSFWDLWDLIQIRLALGKPVFEQWTYLYQHLSLPLATFFTTLLVAPLALMVGRWGASLSTAISIVLVFVWYLLYAICIPLGKIGVLAPFWAGWAQNLLFAFLGGCVWLWLNRGQYLPRLRLRSDSGFSLSKRQP